MIPEKKKINEVGLTSPSVPYGVVFKTTTQKDLTKQNMDISLNLGTRNQSLR